MACGHACDCPTYGAHLRAKNLRLSSVSPRENRAWDRDIDAYKEARRYGVQPDTSLRRDVNRAMDLAEKGVFLNG